MPFRLFDTVEHSPRLRDRLQYSREIVVARCAPRVFPSRAHRNRNRSRRRPVLFESNPNNVLSVYSMVTCAFRTIFYFSRRVNTGRVREIHSLVRRYFLAVVLYYPFLQNAFDFFSKHSAVARFFERLLFAYLRVLPCTRVNNMSLSTCNSTFEKSIRNARVFNGLPRYSLRVGKNSVVGTAAVRDKKKKTRRVLARVLPRPGRVPKTINTRKQ